MKNSLKHWLIEKLGGFVTIDAALNSIESESEKRRILTKAVTRLYNTIDHEDILQEDPETGQWKLEGKPLSDGVKNLLIAEAEVFLNSKLWEVLQRDVKYQANRKMYKLAENEMQLAAGKFWIYVLDIFKTRLKSMRSKSASFNVKKII